MRDSERIDRILNLISILWHEAPDLRLGQLFYNFGGFYDCNYNTEDDDTEMALSRSRDNFIFKMKHYDGNQ